MTQLWSLGYDVRFPDYSEIFIIILWKHPALLYVNIAGKS